MRLSIFTTFGSESLKNVLGDHFEDALACYEELADEVIVVNGGSKLKNPTPIRSIRQVNRFWPTEFSWEFIGQQFQKGYEGCSGDVVIHADADFIFHEKDFVAIREAAQRMLDNNLPAMSFYKYQFVLPDRYNLKSRLVIMVNKRDFGDRIKFNSGGDLAQPSLDGRYISPDAVPQSKVGFYNYEKLTKTKDQIADDVGRMERAYERHFGKTQYGSDGTNEDGYSKWLEAQKGKFNKPQEHIRLQDHPKYVQETIKNLKSNQWGLSGLYNLEVNDYAASN